MQWQARTDLDLPVLASGPETWWATSRKLAGQKSGGAQRCTARSLISPTQSLDIWGFCWFGSPSNALQVATQVHLAKGIEASRAASGGKNTKSAVRRCASQLWYARPLGKQSDCKEDQVLEILCLFFTNSRLETFFLLLGTFPRS